VADIIADGRTRAAWVTTIPNIAAPTVAQLTAGILLQNTLTPAGLQGLQPETAKIDASSLASRVTLQRNGRAGIDGSMLEFKKQDGTDTIYDTLLFGVTGFLVVRTSILEDVAWAAGQRVRVYPMECGEVQHVDIEENTLERYRIPLTLTAKWDLRAVVAA
jgi:hypothetical protein